jgi:hypothetical protein
MRTGAFETPVRYMGTRTIVGRGVMREQVCQRRAPPHNAVLSRPSCTAARRPERGTRERTQAAGRRAWVVSNHAETHGSEKPRSWCHESKL